MRETIPSSTSVERLSPNAARLVLIALLVAAVGLLWVALGLTEPVRRPGPSDLDTYERVVAALRAGQGYYAALHQALVDGGYGTTSPLNWRTPVFLTVLAWFPSLETAQWALGGLAAIAWATAIALVYRRAGLATAIWAGVVMALSLVAIGAPRAELSFELCAGTLILISASAYGLGWRWAGVLAGMAALFVRELAGVYVLVCLGLAIREKRWRETGAWVVGVVAYGAFYAWHWSQIAALLGPADHAAANGWVQFGGLGFVLRTAAFNGVLLVAPYWLTAVVLVAGLVGLSRVPRAAATVVLYLLLFLIYGRPENGYWGGLYGPLVAIGMAFAPGGVLGLWRRAGVGSNARKAGRKD